jgi:hypothetical protein
VLKNLLFKIALFGFALVCCGSASAQTFGNIPALSFTKLYGGANPLPQTVTVTSSGASFTYSVAASTATGGDWLSVSPSGSGCCTTPGSITVHVYASASLPAGTYTAQIVFTQHQGQGIVMTVPVTLTVGNHAAEAFFDNMPGQVSFSMAPKAIGPPTQAVQVRNAGAGAGLNITPSGARCCSNSSTLTAL